MHGFIFVKSSFLKSLLIMHPIEVTSVLAAVGIPLNLLIMYAGLTTSENMASAKLLITHLLIANILQLLSRIFTYINLPVFESCYPMAMPCKISVLFLCIGRRVSMLFTFFIGLFRLLKIQNKNCFILKATSLHLALAASWLCLTFVCFPYVILVPTDRHTAINITKHCTCSFLDSLNNQDIFIKIYDLVLGTGSLYLTIALMCIVSIWMVLLLLKHKKTVFVAQQLNRPKTSQRDITAIKAILALLVCYVTCATFYNTLRIIQNSTASLWQRIMADIYCVISPVVLGLGYPHFRKAMCKMCTKSKTQVMATS